MGNDYKPPSIKDLTAKQLQAITQYGPGALSALTGATQQLAPGQAALDYQLYNQYAQPYFQTGEGLSDIGAQRGVQRDLATIQGGGRELANQALNLDQMANPEFYANRAAAGAGYQSLLAGQDPNKLTGSEMANVERGINRINANRGQPTNIGDATTTASNAMLFGDALSNKRNQFAQSLALFPGIQQGSQSNVNAYQVAAGRGANSGTNASLGRLPNQESLSANTFYGGLLGNVGQAQGIQQGILSNRRLPIDFANQTTQASVGSVCCFIFMEVYNGTLPDSVRICRDFYYQRDVRLSKGYKRMAKWLVPLMRKVPGVKLIVNKLMVQPITRHGEWLTGGGAYNLIDATIKRIWFNIWKNYA